jgi:hypothetical protein
MSLAGSADSNFQPDAKDPADSDTDNSDMEIVPDPSTASLSASSVPQAPQPHINLRATSAESSHGLFKLFQPISRNQYLLQI